MPGIPAIPSEQRNPFDEFDEKNPFDQFDGPQSNYVADKARRLGRAIPEAIGQVIASPGSALQSAAQLGTDALLKVAEKRGDLAGPDLDAARARFERELSLRPEMQAAQALRDVGGQVGKAFPGIGPADPARDREVGSAVASGAASIVPILAAGPFGAAPAIATGAGMMGEQQREDAEQRGATPSQQAASFALGAGTGAVSEAALGVPALLRSVRGAKIVPQALAGAEAGVDKLVASQLGNLGQLAPMLGKLAPAIVPIAQQAVKSAVREGLQEGLEQIAQNTIAKDVVAYDPTRDRTEGAGMAALAGSIVGGGVGAFTQATQGLDTGKNVAETTATLKAQQEQLLAGRRPAQMFPTDAEGKVANELPLPKGMERVETERGVFHFNPQQITADEILSLSAKGEENKILALGSTSKPAATAAALTKNEPLVTITERTPDGTEVRSAVINQSDAEKTMAEMKAGLTPGNTLKIETPKQTLAGRNFVDEELDQAENDAQARRAAEAQELAAREQRQRELDAKKVNVTQAMQQGAAALADPAATYAAIDGALKRVAFYADNNAVSITADQRLGAQRQQAKLAQRLAALEPAEQARRDLENQKRLADDAAALAAKKAQRTEAKQEFKQELQAGRDATGAVDYTRLSDDALAERAQAGDAKAEKILMQRADRAGDDRPTLLDVLARVKLPANDPALGGELKLLTESMTPEQRRKFIATKETSGLDSVAEVFRADHGFSQIQTPADVIDFVERALRGEDIRPDRTGEGGPEFATRARKPIVVWHGSRGPVFESFDMSKAEDGAHFFATNPSHAAFFGNARPYVVQIDNPKTISQTDLENRWDERINDGGESGVLPRDMVKSFVEDAKAEGFDGLIIKDFADVDQESDVYLPFTPQQIKPADDEQIAGPPNKNAARPAPTSRPVRSREEIGTPRPASNSDPEFATIQDTFDLGGTPVGIDLPNEVRNLTPRWQDKALAFESSLDKALYYAGGTNSETRDLVASRLAQQTGLTTGQIATLARTLRTRLEPLTRSTAKASTVRVPAQMRTDVAKLTGAEFAQNATPAERMAAIWHAIPFEIGGITTRDGTRSEKVPAGRFGAMGGHQHFFGASNGETRWIWGSGTVLWWEKPTNETRIRMEDALAKKGIPVIQHRIYDNPNGWSQAPAIAPTAADIDEFLRSINRSDLIERSRKKAPPAKKLTQAEIDAQREEFDRDGAPFATAATAPAPDPTDDATIQREWTALVRAFPRLADLFKLRIGNIQSEFDQAGYRGQVPKNVEAAVWGQKRLIVIAARAWRDRNNGSALLTHEVAHLFWDTLPAEAQEQLRALHAQETAKKTGPLYDAQGFMRGSIQFERDRLPVSRVAADPDLPVKEWFAERIAMLNKAWAEGRLNRTESNLLQRLAFELRQLMRRVVEAFAARSNIDPDSELFESQFRAFIEAGADVRLGQAAGTAYAQRKAQFAQQSTGPAFATGAEDPELPEYPKGANSKDGPLGGSRRIVSEWRDVMPGFQGNKKEMAVYAAEKIRSALPFDAQLAGLAESQEDQTEIEARGRALKTEREQILAEQRAAAREAAVARSITRPTERRPEIGDRIQVFDEIAQIGGNYGRVMAEGEVIRLQKDPITKEIVPIIKTASGRELPVAQWNDHLGAKLIKKTDAAITDLRHPAAVATPEPGEAWAMVPEMTADELRQEREKVGEHIVKNYEQLSRAERILLNARIEAIRAEEKRREPAPRRDAQGNALVDEIPKVDRRAALIAELQRGRALATEGNRTGNDEALKEGTRLVRLATERLDDEFPGWETPARPTTAQAPSAAPDATDTQPGNISPPPPPTPPETAEAAQPDDSEPSPFTGEAEPAEPIRPGKIAEVYGQSSYQPGVVVRAWRKVRDVLAGIRGPVPELPAFPAAKWNAEDGFIRSKGATFYNGIRDFYRALKSGNDYVQRTAEEQVARIARPLIEAGGRFRADDYAKLQARQEQARRLRAQGKTVPPGVLAEIRGLQSAMESNPYVLFNRLVLLLDLKWRHENLKDSAGNPIRLPSALNRTEITSEIKRLGATIATGPHAELIRTALTQHKALVAQVAADLQARELMAAEQLANPYYFPHVTLEIERGGKVEQRELSPTRVRPGTEADFRGYLQTPVGSSKPIETDYVRALYFHLVQVGAHNLKADAIAQHARPYDIMAEVRERAKRLTKTRGQPVSWEQAFHEDYAPQGYVMYGTDSRDAFPTVLVDRDKLARRLGAELTSEDLHQQLERLGQTGVRLLADDLKETLMQGNRETWIVPARVAEALRGIADRETQGTSALDAALKRGLGAWKAWKLFMPWNHIRYEYGNVVADVEKIFSATPGTFKAMPEAAREIRAFWLGGEPNADLRAALKDGVINAITAQEMGGLTRLRAFNEFETSAQKLWNTIKARGSNFVSNPIMQTAWTTTAVGNRLAGGNMELFAKLGDFSSPELSAFREAVFRYANYKHNLGKIRAGERPDYGGAYHRDIEAMQDSKPGAGDRAQRQAAQISKSTFGDYGDLSVLGQGVRDKLIPFYSWMEVNFKYHANLLRNLRDMVRAGEASKAEAAGKGARAAATFAAGFGARAAGGFALRLALPYVAVALWNGGMGALAGAWDEDDEIEKELSPEDRRRFHIILGRKANGDPYIIYGQTALIDIMKWFSGAAFIQQAGAYLNGKTDFPTALAEWRDNIVPDFLNNTVGSFGPYAKVPYTYGSKKTVFPDITDQRTVPAYDMRRVILGQIFDEFSADMVERLVNKDYYGARDFGTWTKQLVLQIRSRDPEAYAFYAIKNKAADFLAKQTGTKRESNYDAPDQQVLRNFRRAIFKGDVEMATQFYQRLLDYGYTAERFKQSIRAQEPLAGLPKDQRRAFLDSLPPNGRDQLARAERYYVRLNAQRGQERGLFPSERSGAAGLERYRQNPQIERLRQSMENVGRLEEDALQLQADRALRESLKKTR